MATFRDRASHGLPVRELMQRVGQPYLRRNQTFTYCTRTAADPDVRVRVVLDRGGRVAAVHRGS